MSMVTKCISQIPDENGDFGGTIIGSDNMDISQLYDGWIDLFGWVRAATTTVQLHTNHGVQTKILSTTTHMASTPTTSTTKLVMLIGATTPLPMEAT